MRLTWLNAASNSAFEKNFLLVLRINGLANIWDFYAPQSFLNRLKLSGRKIVTRKYLFKHIIQVVIVIMFYKVFILMAVVLAIVEGYHHRVLKFRVWIFYGSW